MAFEGTGFEGLLVYEPTVFGDERGYFFESYNSQTFKNAGLNIQFVQDNQSFSKYGVIRGLHYQLPPYAQCKLIRVLQGTILDVVMDLRKSSSTFEKIYSIELSSQNKKQLLVPKGFAHGFSVLSEEAVIMYKCDGFYNKESEAGIVYNDPDLAIDWKIPAGKALVSEKDALLPRYRNSINNFD